jgi:tetraacyldisaccharide 4'-kinase
VFTVRLLLLPLSFAYGAWMAVRNWFFDIGLLSETQAAVPVIAVGNLSAGGTGKTPLVEYLAQLLRRQGKKVAVMSRGYRRSTRGYLVVSDGVRRCAEASASGDEPSQMAETLDGVVVVVDERRARAAQRVVRDFSVEVIVLDDAFQHRFLGRDLNIVVVTAQEVLSCSPLLPAGNRREPFSALRRADLIIVSRARNAQEFADARRFLARWHKPLVGMELLPVAIKHPVTRQERALDEVAGKKVVAFSGIGQPAAFEETLRSLDVQLMEHWRFPDHYQYGQSDIDRIVRSFERHGAEYLLTTEKDVARLRGDGDLSQALFKTFPVYAVKIRPVFREESTVVQLVQNVIQETPRAVSV